MEDEDEIKLSFLNASMVEPPQKEEAHVSEQCDTVLTAIESKTTEEVVSATVEREYTVVNGEESKLEDAKIEELAVAPASVDDSCANVEESKLEDSKIEELVVAPASVDDSGANVEESKPEGVEVVTVSDGGVKMEEKETNEAGQNEGENVEELNLEDVKVVETAIVGDGGLKMDELEVVERSDVVEERRNEGEIVEEPKLEDVKMEEKGVVGDDGLKIDQVEVVETSGVVEEGRNEGENVEESKLEDVNVEETTIVGDDGLKMDELEVERLGVVEEGRNEGENVEEETASMDDDGVVRMEGVIKEEEGAGNEAIEQGSREVNVVGGDGGEEVEEEKEGGGEEMEDSEATADGEISPRLQVVEDEEEVLKEEETPIADAEVVKSGSGSGGKRRRGRIPKASTPVKVPARKIVGEDVCFICLDGGDLVLCDRRFISFAFFFMNVYMLLLLC